jgi:two-component system sensor histidine kinase KdpD
LTTILASSSGLIEMGTIGATERELVALIEAEAAHLNELTARLLTTARLDSAHIRLAKQEVDLVELLRGLARVCTDENTAVEIALQVPTHAPSILADIHLLKMALYHLVDNGAKYANPGSRIEMCLQEREGAVVITVKNSGSYIPMEEREHIFERFYRGPRTASQVAGTGIGLAIAKRVVEAHGGNIWVDSDEQNGTEFSLLLPHAGRPFAKASIWTRDA